MDIELTPDEIRFARKMVKDQRVMRRHGKTLGILVLLLFVAFVFLASFNLYSIAKYEDEETRLTETYSFESLDPEGMKCYVDRKAELSHFQLKHWSRFLLDTTLSVLLLFSTLALRNRSKIEPLQTKIYRSLLEQYEEEKPTLPS